MFFSRKKCIQNKSNCFYIVDILVGKIIKQVATISSDFVLYFFGSCNYAVFRKDLHEARVGTWRS